MRITLMMALCVLTCTVASLGQTRVAAENVLNNGEIKVYFNDNGLAAIEDMAAFSAAGTASVVHRFAADDFSVTINNQKLTRAALRPLGVEKNGERIVYSFASGAYDIKAIYELKPGRRFVSKQIAIGSRERADFRVNRVEIFRARLAEPISDAYVPKSRYPQHGTKDYGVFLRLPNARGLFVTVQNPFLDVTRERELFAVVYDPEMDWKTSYGEFYSDRGCTGPYKLTGARLAAAMTPEWELVGSTAAAREPPGADRAEIEAFTACVRAFTLHPSPHSVKVHVGWCENDYQIDVANEAGRTEYKRIINAAAELGQNYVLYAPGNSALARRDASADDWKWEYTLWLGLGQKIRRGEWNVGSGEMPPSVTEMLSYARSKNIKLLAYVYPSLPFAGNPAWIVENSKHHKNKRNASLGVREYQDWLVNNLVAFYRRTGIGGYSFDYTFLWYEGTSSYAQWWGWRRVLESLREQVPDIVIDGRQIYHEYGPWIWLAGSYPHPSANDEQPESFVPFPDLHFDRVSANRERYTAYRYRNYEFAPSELVPGFITHQTPRNDDRGELVLNRFRARDWDYLGWRYSLLSSISIAGLNNVVNMIPARDVEEEKHFSDADKKWFRSWLKWTDDNRAYLLNTRTIMGQPAIGRVDGTSAIIADRGYLFLFNPNARSLRADFKLDESIGLRVRGDYILRELYPRAESFALDARTHQGVWRYGDAVSLEMEGASARVLELMPLKQAMRDARPLLFGGAGETELKDEHLALKNVRGEVGTGAQLSILLPPNGKINSVTVNGRDAAFTRAGDVVSVTVRFAGTRFAHSQAIKTTSVAAQRGNVYRGSFIIPARIFKQLAARKRAWPIPWTTEDLQTTWLAPERLLLFAQFAQPDDKMVTGLKIDGQPVALRKAYSSVRVNPRSFVGFYLDASALAPEREHRIELTLPRSARDRFQGLFFDNVETEDTDTIMPREASVSKAKSRKGHK